MHSAKLQHPRQPRTAIEAELAGFLALVASRDPLTFPELLELLPDGFQQPGDWRLIVSAHPRVVVWDNLCEATAALLSRLFETQQLALQPCRSMLYDFAARRLRLPSVHALPAVPRRECWLTCTIGIGPVPSFNSQWKIGYSAASASN